ncbi:uncharacterized protein LOC143907863 isoform X1 [Temnothorax americanus]|uniref:uncharacterized protein LOC143907863 isoform X1 n=1 Tax=Temnothorax americanus TaxID=1964332 RepID=UPI004068B078
MRSNAFPVTVDNPLVWYDWFVQDIDQKTSYIQDTVHIITKLKTRFLKPSIVLPMGSHVVSPTHLRILMQEESKLEHGLVESYLKADDKMNFNAAEKIMSVRVSHLLSNIPGAAATQMYLEVMRNISDAYLLKNLTPSERISAIWKSVFFLRIWKRWLQENGYSTSKNFLTTYTYLCIELNAHALVAVIRRLRKEGRPELFLPWIFSSQSCEGFFRAMRSFTTVFSTVVNFDMLDLLYKIRRIQLKLHLMQELSSDVVFPRNKPNSSTLPICELPCDKDIIKSIQEARAFAISEARTLGMKPKISQKVPPPVPLHLYHLKPKVTQDEPILDLTVPASKEADTEEDILLADISAKQEAQLNLQSPFVNYVDNTGKEIVLRKTTLCWLLSNGHSRLSSDRVHRVKQKEDNFNPEGHVETINNVCHCENVHLGDWCAFNDPDNNCELLIGRVLSFSYLTGTGKATNYSATFVPTKDPLNNAKGIGCLCTWFKISVSGVLIPSRKQHSFFNLSNYICSLPRPCSVDGSLRLNGDIMSKIDEFLVAASNS